MTDYLPEQYLRPIMPITNRFGLPDLYHHEEPQNAIRRLRYGVYNRRLEASETRDALFLMTLWYEDVEAFSVLNKPFNTAFYITRWREHGAFNIIFYKSSERHLNSEVLGHMLDAMAVFPLGKMLGLVEDMQVKFSEIRRQRLLLSATTLKRRLVNLERGGVS